MEIDELILKHVRKERKKVINHILRRIQTAIDRTKLRGDIIGNKGMVEELTRDELYKSTEGLERAKNIIRNVEEFFKKKDEENTEK